MANLSKIINPPFAQSLSSHGSLFSALSAIIALTPIVTTQAWAVDSSAALDRAGFDSDTPAQMGSPLNLSVTQPLNQQQQAWQDAIIQQRIEALQRHQPAPLSPAAVDSSLPSTHNTSKPNTADTQPQPPTTADAVATKPASGCLKLSNIRVQGLTQLSKKYREALKSQADKMADDGCVTVIEANDLARSITEAYLQAGYFQVNIKPNAQNLSNNESIWQVAPAKIVAIDNQTSLPTNRLFGDIIDQPANIAWLDQAVSHAERLIDGRLLLDVYPVGDDVRLVVSQQGDIDPVSGDLEWYQNPNDSYGAFQLTGRVELHNVLGQADITSLSLQQSLSDQGGYDRDNQRRSASIYTSIPSGHWQWSALLAGSESDRTTPLPNSILKQSGQDWQANVRGDYVISRDQDSIVTAYTQIAHQRVRNEILGSQIDTQSPTLSSARVGISRTQLFQSLTDSHTQTAAPSSSGAWVVDLSAEKAFGWHDNPATKAGLSDDYWRVLLTGYLTHQHALGNHQLLSQGNNKGYLQLTHELQGQYSQDQLFGVTQQALDGRYGGVRGLSQASNSANSGMTLRNTVAYQPNQAHWLQLGAHQIQWSPYLGFDYGVLKDFGDQGTEGSQQTQRYEYAQSATVGMKMSGYDQRKTAFDKRWDLDLTASRARVNYAPARQVDKDQDTEVSAALKVYF